MYKRTGDKTAFMKFDAYCLCLWNTLLCGRSLHEWPGRKRSHWADFTNNFNWWIRRCFHTPKTSHNQSLLCATCESYTLQLAKLKSHPHRFSFFFFFHLPQDNKPFPPINFTEIINSSHRFSLLYASYCTKYEEKKNEAQNTQLWKVILVGSHSLPWHFVGSLLVIFSYGKCPIFIIIFQIHVILPGSFDAYITSAIPIFSFQTKKKKMRNISFDSSSICLRIRYSDDGLFPNVPFRVWANESILFKATKWTQQWIETVWIPYFKRPFS